MASRLLLLARHLSQSADTIPDSDLLTRFADTRDNDAFAEIVRRHGPVVYRVCQRVVGPATADDAFQATFLVLATRVRAARAAGSLGGWLVGVAGRVARQMRRSAIRRERYETAAVTCDSTTLPSEAPDLAEQFRILDEELTRLPDTLRGPVVSCLLQGRTQERVAAELGQTSRTIRRRLSEARRILRLRLMRRGVMPAVAVGLVTGIDAVSAAIPAGLDQRTVAVVFDFLNGGAALASAPVILAKGVATSMFTRKVTQFAMVAVLGLAGIGFVLADGDDKKPGPIPATGNDSASKPTQSPAKSAASPALSPIPAVDKARASNDVIHPRPPLSPAEIDKELDWERNESRIRDLILQAHVASAKKADSSVDHRMVLVEMTCLRVPEDFCRRAGLFDDHPAAVNGYFVLSRREKRMLYGLLRACPTKDFIAQPNLVTPDGQAAHVCTDDGLVQVVTAFEQSTRDGQTVYIPKIESRQIGANLTVVPTIASDRKSISLLLNTTTCRLAGSPVSVPVVKGDAPGSDPGARPSLPMLIPAKGAAFNIQCINTTITVPMGKSAILRGAAEKRSDNEGAMEFLWILTPYAIEIYPPHEIGVFPSHAIEK